MKIKRFVNVSDAEVNKFLEGKKVFAFDTFLDSLCNINYVVVYEEGD